MPVAQGYVGPQALTAGTTPTFSATRNGAQASADYSARFQEAVLRGKVFSFSDTTGRATALSSATATVGPAIFNPPASGVNMVVWYVGVEVQVAAAGAATGVVVIRQGVGAAAVSGTAATVLNRYTSGGAGACKAFTTPTLDAAGVVVDSLGTQTTAALTVNSPWTTLSKQFDGALICAPNSALVVMTLTTAFGTASAFTTYIWEEVPI